MISRFPLTLSAVAMTALTLMSTSPAAAQDALYDAPPPADAVFIRWLDGAADSPAARNVFGRQIPADMAGVPYAAISAALLDGATPGAHYAVMLDAAGAPQVVTEPVRTDRAKVHVFLASCDGAAALVVADAGMQVVAVDAAGTMASRAVNPVAATLEVQGADGTALGRFDVALRRGQNVTFTACGGSARMTENSFGPVLAAE